MPRSERALRSQLVPFALSRARAAGANVAAILREVGLPATVETEPETVLPLRRFHALLDLAAEAAGDPFFGAHLGAALPRGAYGLVEFTSTSAPTVGEGLRRIVRYISLLNETVEVTLTVGDDEAIFEERIPGEPLCLGRHANECLAVHLLAEISRLTGGSCAPARVWLAHPAPPDRAALYPLLGTSRVAFGRGSVGIALTRRTFDLELRTSDPPLLALLDRRALDELHERDGTSRFLGWARQVVVARLPSGAPTLAEVARGMQVSGRTLQRRLEREGCSFQSLVDEVRRDMALARIDEGRLSLGEIAYLCGYSELSAFTRAFKRWTGRTPAVHRRRS